MDVTGLPVAGVVVPANVTETETVINLLGKVADIGASERLEKVLVDPGTTEGDAQTLSDTFGVRVVVYSADPRPNLKGRRKTGGKKFVPFARAWRVEVAHAQLGRSRRLAESFEKTTASGTTWLELACIKTALDPWSGRSPRPGSKAHTTAAQATAAVAAQGLSAIAPAVTAGSAGAASPGVQGLVSGTP